jgi:hypothetical protein
MALRPIWVGPTDVSDLCVEDGTWRRYGTDFLIECEQKVHKLSDGAVSVSTEIIHGSVVPALVEESKNAGLVVMQHHRMHRKHHLPTLSVTNGEAGRAHNTAVKEEVQLAFAPAASEFPEVQYRVVAMHGPAADVLVAKSELARLLVVGPTRPRVATWVTPGAGDPHGPESRRLPSPGHRPASLSGSMGARSW